MQDFRIDFGWALSWLVPGFVGFIGLGYVSAYLDNMIGWLFLNDTAFGAAVTAVLLSFAIGMAIAAVREVVLDRIHFGTGIARPPAKGAQTQAGSGAAVLPQIYGNLAISVAIAVLAKLYATEVEGTDWILAVCGAIAFILLLAAQRSGLRVAARTMPATTA